MEWLTYSCSRCGRPFLTEHERDRHEAECGLGYKPKKCYHCDGTGYDVDKCKCKYCNGSGLLP